MKSSEHSSDTSGAHEENSFGTHEENDEVVVHPDDQPTRHASFSSPKKIVDIFNLKTEHKQRADATKRPKVNYSTRWERSELLQSNHRTMKQTKYQAFSIENYLKHLLKVNNT